MRLLMPDFCLVFFRNLNFVSINIPVKTPFVHYIHTYKSWIKSFNIYD